MRQTTATAFTLLAVSALLVGVTACGDDTADQGAGSTLPAVTTAPDTSPGGVPATTGLPEGYQHPTGADDVVLEYAELGGFTTDVVSFQATPSILIAGDGRVFTPGAHIAIYPGPLVPPIQVQTISEAGIQRVLAAADEAGLFADVDYSADTNVADATTATVTITANGNTWTHEAYALGLGQPPTLPGSVGSDTVGGSGSSDRADADDTPNASDVSGLPGSRPDESTPQRRALADFIARLGDLPMLVGESELGSAEVYEPDGYLVRASVVDDPSGAGGDGIEPTVVEWPAAASVRLTDATACAELDADEVGDVVASADELTFFDDGGVIYRLAVKPVLPGDSCP